MVSKRFIYTILLAITIAILAGFAVFLAKGYRLSPGRDGKPIVGTGILSITSVPNQASVYLDGHLTSATNTNINSLTPKKYKIKIFKEGFIPWEKEIEVKEGLVTEIKATLFRAIPSIYPLTYSGASNALLSADGQKLAYVVPPSADGNLQIDKKSGIWVWTMTERPIAFARGAEPHQISLTNGLDLSKAYLKWSPDSSQIMVTLPDRKLLLDANRLNDPPRDITAMAESTIKLWEDDQKSKDLTRLQLIKDVLLRKEASGSAYLKWSPDETKFLYSKDGKVDFKVVDLANRKSYPITQSKTDKPMNMLLSWLPDSEHLVMVETPSTEQTNKFFVPSPSPEADKIENYQRPAKISILEFDGFNKSEIYAGNFNPELVFTWPDSSRLVIVSSVATITASQPNLFGINLK